MNFFARHDGVELEFIVTKEALLAVGHFPAPIGAETALAIFDSYEPMFLDAATRVWFAMEDSKPVYFIHDSDLAPDQ